MYITYVHVVFCVCVCILWSLVHHMLQGVPRLAMWSIAAAKYEVIWGYSANLWMHWNMEIYSEILRDIAGNRTQCYSLLFPTISQNLLRCNLLTYCEPSLTVHHEMVWLERMLSCHNAQLQWCISSVACIMRTHWGPPKVSWLQRYPDFQGCPKMSFICVWEFVTIT